VPHYYLPELHQLLQADERYRSRYLLRRSYFEFLQQYWQQISRNVLPKDAAIEKKVT
jgi:fatty acid desaturase